MPRYQSTKTYGTDRGLSTCFRQWRANHSHCSTLHGYSLGFKFVFESETLDEKNWCFDFGGMKPIKSYLDYMFDHTILVAEDDPALETFKALAAFSTDPEWNGRTTHVGYQEPAPHTLGRVAALRVVNGVGCELVAKMVYQKTIEILNDMKAGNLGRYDINPDVHLVSVECFEHGANSAIYYGDKPVAVSVSVGEDGLPAGVNMTGNMRVTGSVSATTNTVSQNNIVDILIKAIDDESKLALLRDALAGSTKDATFSECGDFYVSSSESAESTMSKLIRDLKENSEAQVSYVDLSGMELQAAQDLLEKIKKEIRERRTIDSKTLGES